MKTYGMTLCQCMQLLEPEALVVIEAISYITLVGTLGRTCSTGGIRGQHTAVCLVLA